MKTLLIVCLLLTAFGAGYAQAYQYGVAPAGTTYFTTLEGIFPGGIIDLDIYLTDVDAPQNAGGVWIDFSGSTDDIALVSAGRCMTSGSEGCLGPWTDYAGANIPTPAGPGTHMLVVAGLGGATPDANGNLPVGTMQMQNLGPGAADATVNFTTIPSVATWTPINDTDVNPGAIVIQEICNCTTDAACNDGLFCNGVEVCDPTCICSPGTPPCDDDYECTLDCDEATDSCLTDTCDPSAINSSTDRCCSDPASPCSATGADPYPCGHDEFFELIKESGYYQPTADCNKVVTIKNKICMNNPGVLVSGIQFDICDTLDCLTCIDCELTERTVMFDCVVLELPNGCCRVIMFCKNPGCAINPGECDIVTVVMQTNCNPDCGEDCIIETIEGIIVSDYDGFELAGGGRDGSLCPVMCGDVCPPGSGSANDCGDGVVDIYDIMCEVDFALTATEENDCQAARADVPTGTPPDCTPPDGAVNILDIMVLIDMALNRQDCCSFFYLGIIY